LNTLQDSQSSASTPKQPSVKREPLKELTMAIANNSNSMQKETINKIIEEEREKNRKLLNDIKAIRNSFRYN
jgi:hypothetical protein